MNKKAGWILFIVLISSQLVLYILRSRGLWDFNAEMPVLARIFSLLRSALWTLAFVAVFSIYGRRLFIIISGTITMMMGQVANAAVFLANGHKFPVSGYSVERFTELAREARWDYYILGNSNMPLVWLGDHQMLGGASIGDIFIFVGTIVSILIIMEISFKDREK